MRDLPRHMPCLTDALLCALLRTFQARFQTNVCTPEQLDYYLLSCERIGREEFFVVNGIPDLHPRGTFLCWPTPVPSSYPENNHAWAKVFWAGKRDRFSTPTVIFLPALMSTGDFGYHRIAARFNATGWNAVLFQLPYHHRRTPRGVPSGALALTADLPRNGETLRQAVVEVETRKNQGRQRAGIHFRPLVAAER